MDSTEAQLRLGCALNTDWPGEQPTSSTSGSANRTSAASASRANESANLDSRRGFLNYLLSLMRAESDEHGGILPGLDIGRLEHVAWTLDSLVYLLTHTTPPFKM